MRISEGLVDAAKINEGAWVVAEVRKADNSTGQFNVRTRGLESDVYQRVQAEKIGKLTPEEAKDPKVQYKVEAECIVEGLLLDWDLTDDNDDKVSIPDAALAFLLDPNALRFHTAIRAAAFRVSIDGKSSLDAAIKNS